MLAYRVDDAVLTVCQNNLSKSIEIMEISESACLLLGYSAAEITGRKLVNFIPQRLSELLDEYVEYEENSNDLGAVLSKVQNFSVISRNDEEKTFRLKVVRGESTRNKITFRLVLQDSIYRRKDEALRKIIQDNFKGHEILHPLLNLPDRRSLEKDIELAVYYHRKNAMHSSFLLIKPDNLEKLSTQYSQQQCLEFIKHIARICRSNLRPDDVLGAVSDSLLGILLLDAVSESTRMVANRLRWKISSQAYKFSDNSLISLSASMCYYDIDGDISPELLVAKSIDKISAFDKDSTNILSEV